MGRRADPRLRVVANGKGDGPDPSTQIRANILGELPACPDHLKGHARRQWARTAKLMMQAGLLSDLDLPTLEAYCIAYRNFRDAEAMFQKAQREDKDGRGLVTKTAKGQPYMSVYMQVQFAASRDMVKLGQVLGLNPSSRASIDAKGKGGGGKPVGDGAKKFNF